MQQMDAVKHFSPLTNVSRETLKPVPDPIPVLAYVSRETTL